MNEKRLLKNCLLEMEEFAKNTKTPPWSFLGILSGFCIMDKVVGNFRDELYLFAGGPGAGKSSFLLNLVYRLLLKNEESCGIFLSFDQSVLDSTARLCAISSALPIEQVRDPSLIHDEEDLLKRTKGLEEIARIKERLLLMDQSDGCLDLESLEAHLKDFRLSFPCGPLILGIDPLMAIEDRDGSEKEKPTVLMRKLKVIARRYSACILFTADLDHCTMDKRPGLYSMTQVSGLIYGADTVMLLHNDSLRSFDTPYLEWEWGTIDMMVPVVEMNVVKNRHGQFLGRFFYRFYNSMTRYKECADSENDYYAEMLGNLDYFENPKAKKADLKKKVYQAPRREYNPQD